MPQAKFIIPGKQLKITVEISKEKDRFYLKFPFNAAIKDHVKALEDARWSPERKMWHLPDTQHNIFQLEYLMGNNPYKIYDQQLTEQLPTRSLYEHQIEFFKSIITYRHLIIAGEMGTGKTLAVIEAAEYCNRNIVKLNQDNFWYVGPRSAIKAVEREFAKWNSNIRPKFITYDKLRTTIENWDSSRTTPQFVVYDESSKIKTPTAQRSKAAKHLADAVRKEYGRSGFIVEMSGSPAPKNPTDWWHQCEVACPGFLKEGTINKLKYSMSIIEQREGIGGVYPHLITWLDDSKKCSKCGEYRDNECHTIGNQFYSHDFKPSKNEVERLHRRLKGLVTIKMKKDCLDLPDKQYEIIKLTPDVETLRICKHVKDTAIRGIDALNTCRTISDGFRYVTKGTGEFQCCPECGGSGKTLQHVPRPNDPESFDKQELLCPLCKGDKKIEKEERIAEPLAKNPKIDWIREKLEDMEEVGRLVIWAGFTGSIDLLVNTLIKEGWSVLRVDGRGLVAKDANNSEISVDECLDAMDASHPNRSKLLELHPKLVVVGNPGAGGMAYTFTSSPCAVYYSNSFNGEDRIQSEDRIHRAGMDVNRSCIIYDLILLGTDRLVLENIKNKRRLQDITLGEITEAL